MPRSKKEVSKKVPENEKSLFQKLIAEMQLDQSYLSLVLGLIVVLISGYLVINYFKSNKPDLGPAQQSETQVEADVTPENLPGNYTVKEGDTLFGIAANYYNDGYKFTEIVKANNLTDENNIQAGQVLVIPKLENTVAEVIPTETPTPTQTEQLGTGGDGNQTIWGEKITGNTYTVVAGDWLSKISGRAYGDIMTFDKIAQANNIANPDLIEPGTVLTIPR